MSNRMKLSEDEVVEAILAFRDSEGRDPRPHSAVPKEKYIARRMKTLSVAARKRLGKMLTPGEQKAHAVIDFAREHGHTPRMNSADDQEASIGQWLITYARRHHRSGTLPAEVAKILLSLPGVLDSRQTPNQGDRVAELRKFLTEKGRLPRQREAEEKSLAAWVYAQRPGDRKAGGVAQERSLLVQEIIAPYRGRDTETSREERLLVIHDYVRLHGHLPKASVLAGIDEIEQEFPGVETYADRRRIQRREAVLEELVDYIDRHGMLPPADAASAPFRAILEARRTKSEYAERVKAIIDGVPAHVPARRKSADERLSDLLAFIEEHGIFPGPSTDGNLYRWAYYTARRDSDMGRTVAEIIEVTPSTPRGRQKAK